MSDTPQTDEAQFGTGRVSVDFARRLERELAAERAALAKLKATLADPGEVELAMIRGDIAIPDRVEFDGIRETKNQTDDHKSLLLGDKLALWLGSMELEELVPMEWLDSVKVALSEWRDFRGLKKESAPSTSCIECGSETFTDEGRVTWCGHCGWNHSPDTIAGLARLGDCDCDDDETSPVEDYNCGDCGQNVKVCSGCYTIRSGCKCGGCPCGTTFYEE